MARNDSDTRAMCVLTVHGRELGDWSARIYEGENPELPDWVAAFLQPVFTRMRRLLEGGKRRKPPDYELCRWLRYCYLLNHPSFGVALFNLILADHVDPVLFKQAERQARILKLRLEEGQKDTPENSKLGPKRTPNAGIKLIQPKGTIAEADLVRFTHRNCAILKLLLGQPLSTAEIQCVLPEHQAHATQIKGRSLREIATIFGVSKERVRQVCSALLRKLGVG